MTFSFLSFSQKNEKLKVGAERTELFLNDIKEKNVAIVANLTSIIKSQNS